MHKNNTEQSISESGTVLITGATGYLGSHMRVSLLEAGYKVVGVDTCERSAKSTLDRIAMITGKQLDFVQASIAEYDRIVETMRTYGVATVIHFAAYKAVGESCEKPGLYIENNIGGTITLLRSMETAGVKTLIFSSSATVYDGNFPAPYAEDSPVGSPSNPYGASKFQIEQILDVRAQFTDLSVLSLRYFNPVGAHSSGLLGEDIRYSQFSLTACVMQTLLGQREQLAVFGDDRPSHDGSCIRDYITVGDLIRGHRAALEYITTQNKPVLNEKINLGTGSGTTVLEFLDLVAQATGKTVPYTITDRRPGDLGVVYASADKAKTLLGRSAQERLVDALRAQWEFVEDCCG